MKIFLYPLIFCIFATPAQAGLLFDVGGVYLTDDLSGSSSSTRTASNYFYHLGAMFTIKKNLWGGWNYSGISQTESASGVTVSYVSQDTGPYIKWQFGRGRSYSMSGVFNILSRATFSEGGALEKWDGTSYLLQFAFTPEIKEGLHIGGSLNYYGANYTKKTISGTETTASNTKTSIFPMISLTKEW